MSKISADDLVNFLKARAWLHDFVGPHFSQALREKTPSLCNHATLLERSVRTYRKDGPAMPPLDQEILLSATTADEQRFWQYACAVVSPGTVLLESTPARKTNINNALSLIEQNCPKIHAAMQSWLTKIIPVQNPAYRSASHPHFFGAIFLNPDRDPKELAISIVHEFAHQELFLLNLADRLVNSDSDFSLVHAPFQNKLRPPIGRLHSAHALFRMIDIEQKIQHENYLPHKKTLEETIDSFKAEELTPIGQRLIREVYAQ